MSELRRRLMMQQTGGGGVLPPEYQQVEYLESSGSQYIRTDTMAYSTSRIIIDMEVIGTNNYVTLGAFQPQTNFILGRHTNNKLWDSFVNINVGIGPTVVNNRITVDHTFNGNVDIYEGGVKTYTYTSSGWRESSDAPIGLFGLGNGQYRMASRIYEVIIYGSDDKIAQYIPCYRKADNEPGMYDIVNDIFYTNAGSGSFTIEYTLPDGTPWAPGTPIS